jgi:hypothetical protein
MDTNDFLKALVLNARAEAERMHHLSDDELTDMVKLYGFDPDYVETDDGSADFSLTAMLRAALTPAQLALLMGEPTPEVLEATGLRGIAALGVLQGAATAAARRPELAED